MEQLIVLFKRYTKTEETPLVVALPISGSSRKYYRLSSDSISVIGVDGSDIEENRAFVYLSNHFSKKGLNTPKVLAVSSDERFYIQDDLGEESLFALIESGRTTDKYNDEEKLLLSKSISRLAEIQIYGASDLDFNRCYPQSEFNKRTVFWDLNYFKYSFLKTLGVDFQEDLLENDFEKLANDLTNEDSDSFMYRDFQSRNIIIRNSEPYFIDFQGGRKGPIHYDVASFLWQAKANIPSHLKEELIESYIDTLSRYRQVDKKQFRERLNLFVLFRTIQVLGAYGFRGYFEKKQHFLESIPYAINNLREIIKDRFAEYPHLREILVKITERVEKKEITGDGKNLEVKVYSFSYKKGIPEDNSGNGGGYVFDCRAINNPGREERFRNVTGLDSSVKEFLEEDGEITIFLESVSKLIDKHVERYIERQFTNLMISFGCTGGQHRSVYSAQYIAERISNKYGVKVNLIHREQNIEQSFSPREVEKQ